MAGTLETQLLGITEGKEVNVWAKTMSGAAAPPGHCKVLVSKYIYFLCKNTQISNLAGQVPSRTMVYLREINSDERVTWFKLVVAWHSGLWPSPQQLHCRFPALNHTWNFFPVLCFFMLIWRRGGWLNAHNSPKFNPLLSSLKCLYAHGFPA